MGTCRHRRIGFTQTREIGVGLQGTPRARFEFGFALTLIAAHRAVREVAVVHAPQRVEVVPIGGLRNGRPIVLGQPPRQTVDRLPVGVCLSLVEAR
ncbi:hypothetical protein LMG28140_06724 [Paraburkholderia metrosideri]|uniref:Uncharacterized protein n=1 Tax=Paraburkholderia metrosideri TaxID=580937 RepID=A0ABM8P9H6_9BURK|nr:hypothetical protein LMG28140_06724 [Paraburkholderia metrosideri]